jgi:ABC-type multidrug transport system fused ATPase/permease subunit
MSSPLLLILSALLIFLYFRGLRLQLVGGRDLETIVSSTASAILDRHASTASGLETIRAFGRLPAHLDAMHTTLDASQLARQHQALAQRWINLWLRLHSALFVAAVAAAVLSRAADPSAAGFALGAAVQFSGALAQISRKLGKPDALLGAVERIAQYADMPREPALDPGPGEDGDGDEPPPDWPSSGALSVDDLSISYAPDAPPALRAVGFSLRGGERLGVVGRTGAGKSTLVAALPRFAPVSGGRVLIDGLDLSRLRLGAVRAAVALVPQDPFLFSGSLRENLAPGLGRGDADGGGGDACLLAALRRVGLVEDGSGSSVVFPSGLDTAIRDGGRNLSHGQRQLVCLARALVAQQHPDASSRRPAPRVLILDEATSAVDGAADAALQRVVRSAFAGTTLVVVAHRLSTVADFDKVLVLRDGEAVEFGAPRELAARRGLFWEMVCQSPEKEALPGILEM